MRYLSLFSGIEAASVAWSQLGWEPVAFCEIEKFPCAVLAHHYPNVPNLGNVQGVTQADIEALGHIDVVVFGFPCQDLSVAGKREGLADGTGRATRSGLFWDAMRIVRWSRARWAIAENVPGLFSSKQGRDFAAVVGDMAGTDCDIPDAGWANTGAVVGSDGLVEWSVLDAQWFGLAQRRKRVFLVRDIGDWRRRPPVLFEREGLQGHPAPSREAGQGVANALTDRPDRGGGNSEGQRLIQELSGTLGSHTSGGLGGSDIDGSGAYIPEVSPAMKARDAKGASSDGEWPAEIAPTLNAHFGTKQGLENQHIDGGCGLFVTHSLRAEGFDASEDGTGRGIPLVTAFSVKDHGADAGEIAPTLRSGGHDKSHANGGVMPAVAFDWQSGGDSRGLDPKDTAQLQRCQTPALHSGMVVRRLTPRECERLQGFPDDYTLIPYRGKDAADGPRYKALGNSMAVPVMGWLGKRIALVESWYPLPVLAHTGGE